MRLPKWVTYGGYAIFLVLHPACYDWVIFSSPSYLSWFLWVQEENLRPMSIKGPPAPGHLLLLGLSWWFCLAISVCLVERESQGLAENRSASLCGYFWQGSHSISLTWYKAHSMFSEGFPFNSGPEWMYLGCILLLGWKSRNKRAE